MQVCVRRATYTPYTSERTSPRSCDARCGRIYDPEPRRPHHAVRGRLRSWKTLRGDSRGRLSLQQAQRGAHTMLGGSPLFAERQPGQPVGYSTLLACYQAGFDRIDSYCEIFGSNTSSLRVRRSWHFRTPNVSLRHLTRTPGMPYSQDN